MKRVKRFGVFQTAKVASIIMFFVSFLFTLPFWLVGGLIGEFLGPAFPGIPFKGSLFFLFIPFFYAIVGFISTAISCLVYNFIARWTGGIELEIVTVDSVLE